MTIAQHGQLTQPQTNPGQLHGVRRRASDHMAFRKASAQSALLGKSPIFHRKDTVDPKHDPIFQMVPAKERDLRVELLGTYGNHIPGIRKPFPASHLGWFLKVENGRTNLPICLGKYIQKMIFSKAREW